MKIKQLIAFIIVAPCSSLLTLRPVYGFNIIYTQPPASLSYSNLAYYETNVGNQGILTIDNLVKLAPPNTESEFWRVLTSSFSSGWDFRRNVRTLYQIRQGEWDSENYLGHAVTTYVNLYDFAQDQEVKSLAKSALDWFFTSGALKYWRGGFGGPSKRDYSQGNCVWCSLAYLTLNPSPYQGEGSLHSVPIDDSREQTELLLSGLVEKHNGYLKIKNSIYRNVFNAEWVLRQLDNLRPYSQTFNPWVASGYQDESRLLRGQALKDAQKWSQGKSLGDLDYRFLAASVECDRIEVQTALEAARAKEVEARLILEKAQLVQEKKTARLQRFLLVGVCIKLLISSSLAIGKCRSFGSSV